MRLRGLPVRADDTHGQGRPASYTCAAKAAAGAGRCGGKPIRQDALDAVVLDTLLERSDQADQRRRSDLVRVQRERVAAQTKPGHLYALVEEGLASARDTLFAERLAEHRNAIAQIEASKRSLSGQLAAGKRLIDEATVERFSEPIRNRMTASEAAVAHGTRKGTPMVPSFDREWCRLQDSNL